MPSRDVLAGLIQTVGIAALLFVLWWIAKLLFQPADYILPSPWAVLAVLGRPEHRLLEHGGITLFESVLGFAIGNGVALVCAILFQWSASSRKILMPIAILLKTTPIVAIAPLLLIWFGPSMYTKVVASALVCFFPMLVGLYDAMSQTPAAMVEYFDSLGTKKYDQIMKLKLLYAMPEMFAALRVSSTLAVVGAVVGEMVSATSGLGYVIISSSYSFQTEVTFAAILLTAITGFLLFGLVSLIDRLCRITNWRD